MKIVSSIYRLIPRRIRKKIIAVVAVLLFLGISINYLTEHSQNLLNYVIPNDNLIPETNGIAFPDYDGSPYVVINSNVPLFTEEQLSIKNEPFISLSELDELGRCGSCLMVACKDNQAYGERGDISEVKPSGWNQAYYEDVENGWLYNRCHLLGWQLSGLNDDERNLITGTRYMNVTAMLEFENLVDDTIENNPEIHILYRVTPVYQGNELVARGVLMEAYSLEDNGKTISFCVYCYNIQPGIDIDYLTGESYGIQS